MLVGLLHLPGISSLIGCEGGREIIPYCLQDTDEVNEEETTNFSGPSIKEGENIDVSYDVTVVGQEYSENDCSSYATVKINGIEHTLEYSKGEDGQCYGDCVELDSSGIGAGSLAGGGCDLGYENADSDDSDLGVAKLCLPDYNLDSEQDIVTPEYVTLKFYTRDPDCDDDNVWTPGGDPAPDEWGETAPDEWVVE